MVERSWASPAGARLFRKLRVILVSPAPQRKWPCPCWPSLLGLADTPCAAAACLQGPPQALKLCPARLVLGPPGCWNLPEEPSGRVRAQL